MNTKGNFLKYDKVLRFLLLSKIDRFTAIGISRALNVRCVFVTNFVKWAKWRGIAQEESRSERRIVWRFIESKIPLQIKRRYTKR